MPKNYSKSVTELKCESKNREAKERKKEVKAEV